MTAIRFATSIVLGLVATTSAFAAEPEAAPVATPSPVAATAAALAGRPLKAPSRSTRCSQRQPAAAKAPGTAAEGAPAA